MTKSLFAIFALLVTSLGASARPLMTCVDTYFPGKVTYVIESNSEIPLSVTLISGNINKTYKGSELAFSRVGNVATYTMGGSVLAVNMTSAKAIMLATTVDGNFSYMDFACTTN